MSDLKDVLLDAFTYRGQNELYFDAVGNACMSGKARFVLVWRDTKKGIKYVPK